METRVEMTVGKLREILSQLDAALPVRLADWNEEYAWPCPFYTDDFSLREENGTIPYLCLGNDGRVQAK